ncbi:nSTAND1 domain-containing NTPase [Geodermatophilus arenarius]|uniref:BTAD domain-containing putative transcriptional regulator n=1 Tax=Geodermatophilus arenarius TaxID=1137990 RepID=A0ABV9LIR1_9ACTN
MRIAVLGPLEVRGDDGTPVAVPGAKERLLLAVLAAGAPAVVPTDRIVEELWDGDPPASARKSLQAHLVRLRSALEPDRPRGSTGRHVVRRGPGYALAVERDDLDALALGDLATRGRAALAAGDPAAAAELLGAALHLWRGDPYADWPDAPFAEAERRRLTELRDGALTACTEARLALGEAAALVPDLERLVTEQPLREEWWRLLVLALYRAGRQADALGAARRARSVLAEELGADPGPALRAAEAAVLAQDPALDPVPVPVPAPASGACPYMGLRAYRAEDAPLFAGRERVVATLAARLVDAPLLAVSGPSGAGKSSVVRAGLVPALAAGALPGSAGWQPVVLLPGRRPVDALADLTGEDPPSRPVLLVCDQFEELWAAGVDPAERTAFLDAVLALLDDGFVARCVVVVRGDAVGRLAEHPGLVDRLGPALVLVPPMTDPELRAVVRDPAAAVGLRVEDDLVDAVVADGLGRPGALPLLSTALVGTWERRRGDLLTLAGYVAAGGVAGALARSAEAAYAALDEPARELARRLFVRLADVDDAGALVRRPLPTADLGPDGPRRAVAEEFLARRLLSVDADRLEVTHEALLTAWPRLVRWLEEDAAGRAVRRHLTPAAREWDAAGRPDDELYRGARLTAALDWATGAGDEPTPVEQAFLAASRAHAERDLADAREQARLEVRRRRRTRRLAVGLAAALAAALVVAVVAVRAEQDAEARETEARQAALVADANRLATLSTRAGPLDLSLLLAAQAVRLAETPDTQDRLLTTLVEHRRVARVLPVPGGLTDAVVTGGATLLLQGSDWTAWSPGDPGPRVVREGGAWWGTTAVAGSPTEEVVAGAGWDFDRREAWLRLLDTAGEDRLLAGAALGGFPAAVAFTPDGGRIRVVVARLDPEVPAGARWWVVEVDRVSGRITDLGIGGATVPDTDLRGDLGRDGATLVTWADGPGGPATLSDLTTGRQAVLQVPSRPADGVGFRALPSGAAQLWSDGAVTLHGPDGAVRQVLDAHRGGVFDVEQSPDGSWAVTVGGDPGVLLWDVDPVTGLWTQREVLSGHAEVVEQAEIAPAGDRLFTAAPEDTVVAWDVRPSGGFGQPYPDVPGWWVAGRPEVVEPGRLAVVPVRRASAGGGGTVLDPPADTREVGAAFLDPVTGRVLDVVPVGELPSLPGFSYSWPSVASAPPVSVAVGPDRRRVAVTSGLATTVVDARTRRVLRTIRLPATGELDAHGGPLPAAVVSCVEWVPDGADLLLCSRAGGTFEDVPGLAVVDATTGRVRSRSDSGSDARVSAVGPGHRLLALSSESRPVVRILDRRTLVPLGVVLLRATDRVEDMAFSPDGRRLVVVGAEGVVQVVDTARRVPVGQPARVGVPLLQADWLPDGRTVAVSAIDGTVSLVDAERGLLRGPPLPVSTGPAESPLHLVTDGDELIALSGESPGRRYLLDPEEWLTAVCAMAGRDLTPAEWEQYLPGRGWQRTCTDLL